MNRELVSIVMATYNGEKYLRAQMDSILAQTYKNLEIVVVDDVSTDSTLRILQEYAIKDNRIYIYPSEKNRGVVANFERGIELARGEFVALSDQDDIWLLNKIELQIAVLSSSDDLAYVFSDAILCRNELVEVGRMWNSLGLNCYDIESFNGSNEAQARRLIIQNIVQGSTMVFKKSKVDKANIFPIPNGLNRYIHDGWIATMLSLQNFKGIGLKEPLIYYRQHAEQLLGAGRNAIVKESVGQKILNSIRVNNYDYYLHDYRKMLDQIHNHNLTFETEGIKLLRRRVNHLSRRDSLNQSSNLWIKCKIVLQEFRAGNYKDFSHSNLAALKDLFLR